MKSGKYTVLWLAMVLAMLVPAKPAKAQVNFVYTQTCLGAPVQFLAQVPNPLQIAIWYWQFGDGATSNQQNPWHAYGSAGSYQVVLSVTDIYNVTSSVTHVVTMNPLPTAYFQYMNPTCSNQPVQFTDLSSSLNGYIAQWTWHFGDGTPDEIIVFPNNPNVSHLFQQAGTFNVVLTVQNSEFCTSSISGPVTLAPAPAANFNFTGQCALNVVQFTDASLSNNGGNIIAWDWNFGDPPSGMNNISTLSNPMHTYSEAGTYAVREIVTNFNGCADTILMVITIHASPGVGFYTTGSCVGAPVTFTPDPAVTNINAVAVWYWTFGDGMSSSMQNPQHVYALAGSYTATLTITDISGCTASVSHTITINPPPIAAFSYAPNACAGSPVAFTNLSSTSSGYITEWTWQFGDGTTQTIHFPGIPNITHTYSNPGNFSVTLTIVTSYGCTGSITYMVQVAPVPIANFSNSDACTGLTVFFSDLSQTNGGGPIVAWDWNFGDPASGTGNTSSLQNPVYVYPEPGAYVVRLIISNMNGCQDTLYRGIAVSNMLQAGFTFSEPQLNVPVQFTDVSIPNGSPTTAWAWNFGDGNTSAVHNPTHTYSLPGYYNVTLLASNSYGCSDMADSVLYVPSVTVGNTLNGMVYAGSAAINEVIVQLVQVDNTGFPLAVQGTIPGQDHSFVFENVPEGFYYLRAKPVTGSSFASIYLPTFYENSVYWEDATLLNLGIAQNPYDIHLVSYIIENNGTYIINGQLVNDDKSLSVADQVVLLLGENNTAVGWTLTDINGNFSFAALQAGTYGINPVITGLTTYPYFVVLDESTSPAYVSMIVSGQTITGIDKPTAAQQGCRIFPNPANNAITITSGESIERIVFLNSQGQTLLDVNKPGILYRCDSSQFPAGVCFVKVLTAGKETITKVIVIY